MKQYNIYAGLSDSFGGVDYQYTASFENQKEADEEAFVVACDIYESYEGLHGILSYYDVEEQYCQEKNIEHENLTKEDYEEIDIIYYNERDNWISYYAIPTEKDDIMEDELVIED